MLIFAIAATIIVLLIVVAWLLLPTKVTVEDDAGCFDFVKGVTEADEPRICQTFNLGYFYTFELVFKDVEIEIEYNIVRRQWTLEHVRSHRGGFIFYYDVLSAQPKKALDFLLDKYGLVAKMEEHLEQHLAKQAEQDAYNDSLRQKKIMKA